MQDNMVEISLDDFMNFLAEKHENGTDNFDTNSIFVIKLENCNGITTDLLETFKKVPVEIKFKIQGDLYGIKSLDFEEQVKYNYTLDEMEKIISVFEEFGKEMPDELTEIVKKKYIYIEFYAKALNIKK